MNKIKDKIALLRNNLKHKEREKEIIWENYWFVLWIFLPFIGWIILVINLISRANKSTRLERECREIREQIWELEKEDLKD